MVQKFLLALRIRGGLITSVIVISVAKALIARNSHLILDLIDLDSPSWAKSLFRRMGFKKTHENNWQDRGAKKEAQLLYLHDIVSLVDDHNILDSLILNLDQTKLKYILSANHTLAKKGSKSIETAGSDDKRCITGIIYMHHFPESFSLSVNPKHYSDTLESIKIINEVIIPYVIAQREILRNPNQGALLICNVFRGQIIDEVTLHLLQGNIYFVTVPNNMTHLFQPLDLTVNGHCKTFMKNRVCKMVYATG